MADPQALVRQYRDHRLEWMMKTGAGEIVRDVVFDLAAVPGSTPLETPTHDRCATLQEFIETLGGQCSGDVDDKQVMRLVLELTAEVEHA